MSFFFAVYSMKEAIIKKIICFYIKYKNGRWDRKHL